MRTNTRARRALGAVVCASALAAGTTGLAGLASAATDRSPRAWDDRVSFELQPIAKWVPCLQADEDTTPTVKASLKPGKQVDTLVLRLRGFKPDTVFQLFTIETSPLLADGTADPAFAGDFGLGWYQADIETNGRGRARVVVKSVLADEVFGLDPGAGLEPTRTFNVGFWFGDPADAAACGFTGSTPFGGNFEAGPLAAVTRPGAEGLGPLCTAPVLVNGAAECEI